MNNWSIKPAKFAVLRTPLLPENSTNILHNNNAEKNLDWQLQNSLIELKRLIGDHEVSQSIRLASASLYEKLDQLSDQLSVENLKLASSIYKYIVRMSTRPTPFGAFSNVMSLPVADETQINIPEPIRLYARLDNSCVNMIAEQFQTWCANHQHMKLQVRANSSLYELAGEYRFVRQKIKENYNTYNMDAVQINHAIQVTIQACKNWTMVKDVVTQLKHKFRHLKESELTKFIYDLLDNQILEGYLGFVVGSRNSFDSLLKRAKKSSVDSKLLSQALQIQDKIAAINELDESELPNKLTQVEQAIGLMLPNADIKKWIHIDAFRSGQQQKLGQKEVNNVIDTVQKLAGLFWKPSSLIQDFTHKFQQRYEDAEVSLLEALDVDNGIGFGPQRNGRSPLLNGIGFGQQQGNSQIKWEALDAFMLVRVVEAIRKNASLLTIKLDDFETLKPYFPVPKGAFLDTVSVLGTFMKAEDEGRTLFKMNSIGGPSALSLLGRFCCGDQFLADSCKDLADQEQALQPNVIKAEIIHAQQSTIGNISGRPQLRNKEIIYSPGDSDIDADNQIKCEDLFLKIQRGRMVLFSKKLGTEISPRLASAHNTSGLNLPVYQFLNALQYEAGYFSSQIKSKPLDLLPYLPEIRIDNIILSPQRWLISVHEIRSLQSCKDIEAKIEQLKKIKKLRKLSKFVAIKEGDNILDFNLESAFSCLMLISELVKKKSTVILIESLNEKTSELISRGTAVFRHEVVLPLFASHGQNAEQKDTETSTHLAISEAKQKASLPNEAWKYLKIYTGEASADRLLADHLSGLANKLVAEGKIKHWHFIRYTDPDFHIRIRFKLKQQFKTDEIDASLYPEIKTLYQQGLITSVSESSHMPEFERYGGPELLPLCEQLFYHNSLIVTDFIQQTASLINRDELRWQLSLHLTWQLALGMCGSLDKLEAYFKQSAASYDREFGNNEFTKKKLSENYRMNMKQVAEAVSPDFLTALQSPVIAKAYATYSRTVSQLKQACEKNNKDELSILQSLIHMDCNRSFVLLGRANEWIVYHYLMRYTRTVIARKFTPGNQVAAGLSRQINTVNHENLIGL